MKNQQFRRYPFILALAFVCSLGLVGRAAATTQSSSSHYMVTESQFGVGASEHDCSTNYCARSSVGDTSVGRGSSSNYSAQFGANTTDVPLLEVIVTGGTHDMGVLDNTHTGTATDTIKVRSYLSTGYTLYIAGATPNQGIHGLTAMNASCPCTSQPGAEQFGINLADNATPNIGANPVQVPSGSFSYGQVLSDYNQADLFKYHDGDPVAQSLSSTGETDYTLSLLINVSNVTPGGRYSGSFSAIAVPVF